MKIKRSEKGRCKLYTFASLEEDYSKFVQSGYNIKNAKFHDVTEEAMFDVPVYQVFVMTFLPNKNIIKGCLYQFIQKERG